MLRAEGLARYMIDLSVDAQCRGEIFFGLLLEFGLRRVREGIGMFKLDEGFRSQTTSDAFAFRESITKLFKVLLSLFIEAISFLVIFV